MRLTKARIRDYRSIIDSGQFEIEAVKTILVGPNEAGKTAILLALEALNPPKGRGTFTALRDFPRSKYDELKKGKVKAAEVTVVEGVFELSDEDRAVAKDIHPAFEVVKEVTVGRRLDNARWIRVEGSPKTPTYGEVKLDLTALKGDIVETSRDALSAQIDAIVAGWKPDTPLGGSEAGELIGVLETVAPQLEKTPEAQARHNKLILAASIDTSRDQIKTALAKRIPVFVYFSEYYRVRPSIHLRHLAERLRTGALEDELYDFGNLCLLKLLGFTVEELAAIGEIPEPAPGNPSAMEAYKAKLDHRSYSLNAASVSLTDQVNKVWGVTEGGDKLTLRIVADRQYLKVVVEDELGVDVELDQRSAGLQWLVSFLRCVPCPGRRGLCQLFPPSRRTRSQFACSEAARIPQDGWSCRREEPDNLHDSLAFHGGTGGSSYRPGGGNERPPGWDQGTYPCDG